MEAPDEFNARLDRFASEVVAKPARKRRTP